MKFRKKPVVVEAAQFDADKAHNLPEPFASAICRSWDDPSANLASLDYLHELGIAGTQRTFEVENRAANQHIHTLEGAHMVDDHDWIIRGVKGEFYPCKPDIFDMTYERVPGVTTDLAPRIVNPRTGELVGLEVGGAISVDEAAEQLPLVTAAIAHLIRVKDYLRDVITDSMVKAGQTERLMGEALYELKGDASWIVDDQGALFRALVDACSHDQITRLELDDAVQQVVEFVFHQGKLNALARRVPAVDQLRRRVEGEPRLRQKR